MSEVKPVENLDNATLKLVRLAMRARKRAYAPYSKYRVGCALRDDKGKLFTGCNVETANYSGTVCAERTALVKMVSRGGKRCRRIVVVTSSEVPAFPCGECLQMINELGRDSTVFAVNHRGTIYREASLQELFPYAFSKEMLTP